MTSAESIVDPLAGAIRRGGFAFAPAWAFRPLLAPGGALADWDAFAASWNDLALDTHLPDGHRYRRRRHGTFSARAGERAFRREPHAPTGASSAASPSPRRATPRWSTIHG